MTQTTHTRPVQTNRVDSHAVAQLLPSILGAWGGDATPLAPAALVAGASPMIPDLEGWSRFEIVETAVDTVGRDYADGFLDGFTCTRARRDCGVRYALGLQDARQARQLLLKLPWARALLEPGVAYGGR